MYKVYKVPVDAYDDPPICGVIIGENRNYGDACEYADKTMEQELNPEVAYFVMSDDDNNPIYSVGYIKPIEVTA